MKFIYLHGFASGPGSGKAAHFREVFARSGRELLVPDLAEGDFENLTVTSQLRVVERTVGNRAARLIGSSLGGYLAALYAGEHAEVDRLVLLAPAFGFIERWPAILGEQAFAAWKRSGFLETFHYGDQRMRRISYRLYEDALGYPAYPEVSQPTLLFHGVRDDVVPVEHSRRFAAGRQNVDLRELDAGHELLEPLPEISRLTLPFLD